MIFLGTEGVLFKTFEINSKSPLSWTQFFKIASFIMC